MLVERVIKQLRERRDNIINGNTGSAIRELFEYGKKRKEIVGEENVFDYYYWLMENEQDKLKYKYERSNSSHNSENTYILCMFIFVILGLFMVMTI